MDPNALPPPPPSYQSQAIQTARPSQGLAVAGLVLAFIIPPVGLILSIVALSKAKQQGGVGQGLAIAGTIIGSLVLLVQILVVVLLVVVLLPLAQREIRNEARQEDVSNLGTGLENYVAGEGEGRLPDEAAFSESLSDYAFQHYNPSLAELVGENPEAGSPAHILYVQNGQPGEGTHYPDFDSLHIWGGSLCGPSPPSIDDETYAGRIEAAAPGHWAIVYRLEPSFDDDGELQERLVCEDSGHRQPAPDDESEPGDLEDLSDR